MPDGSRAHRDFNDGDHPSGSCRCRRWRGGWLFDRLDRRLVNLFSGCFLWRRDVFPALPLVWYLPLLDCRLFYYRPGSSRLVRFQDRKVEVVIRHGRLLGREWGSWYIVVSEFLFILGEYHILGLSDGSAAGEEDHTAVCVWDVAEEAALEVSRFELTCLLVVSHPELASEWSDMIESYLMTEPFLFRDMFLWAGRGTIQSIYRVVHGKRPV